MENEVAIQLAVDVLQDHFGEVVARVGRTLLQRGELSLQDVLRFGCQSVQGHLLHEEEPFGFPSMRNALMVLLQHGMVAHRSVQTRGNPHPQGWSSGPQLYSIDIEEVLTRLRFPQFLEYTYFTYGVPAYQLVNVLLRHGRVAASFAIAEARRAAAADNQQLSAEDLERMLRQLVQDRLLVEVQPCSGGATSSNASPDNGESTAAAAARGSQPPLKRARNPGAADSASPVDFEGQLVPANGAAGCGTAAREAVYRYSRHTYNLCLCKSLLCRLVEDRLGPQHGGLLEVLLSAAVASENGTVTPDYMSFAEIATRMESRGSLHGDELRQALSLLSSHADSLLVKRMSQRMSHGHVPDPRATRRAGRAAVVLDNGVGRGPGIPEPDFEYAVEWQQARRQLKLAATVQIIREQFGPMGLRMFNLLSARTPPQKLEDKEIFSNCMVPEAEGRALLHRMVTHGVVDTQEIPKSESSAFKMNFWLYYVDVRRLQLAILEMVLQSILNLRVRFRVENAKVAPLESRASSLTARERATLREGRRVEDVLERSYLILDTAVLVLRCA